MDLLASLKDRYSSQYQTESDGNASGFTFLIHNPNWPEHAEIDFESGELTFYFAYQHAHFATDLGALIEYVDLFLSGAMVSVEFYVDDFIALGGGRYVEEIDASSPSRLLKSFSQGNLPLYRMLKRRLKRHRCRCLIRGWNDASNQDIDFTLYDKPR